MEGLLSRFTRPERCEVTEVCPHCESEITMTWDVQSRGYRAFCPVCGERLMLCDECLHSGSDGEYTGRCDYDSKTDTCYRRQDRAKRQILRAETPLGTLTAQAAVDPEHPGIWLDLCRGQSEMPLALVEFSPDEPCPVAAAPAIITRVWGDARQEDPTDRVVHQSVEWYFTLEEVKEP